jgi:arylsulfatase A-like enzyme
LLYSVFLLVLHGAGCSSANKLQTNLPTERPNIIVMYSDDHTAQAVGAYRGVLNYGLQLDHTPASHIDRLAERGMRFDNAFDTNSICVPFRTVMLSGSSRLY